MQEALPLVPGTEADCCARLVRTTCVEDRDTAAAWLALLRHTGLADRTARGYRRAPATPDRDAFAASFLEAVFGAREALDAVTTAGGWVGYDSVFERVATDVPAWERHRDPGRWRARWRDRLETVLEWLVLLGVLERRGEEYRAAGRRA